VLGAFAPAAFPQSADDIKSLRRDLDSVRDSQKLIQGQLDTIVKMLQNGAGAGAGAQPQGFTEAVLNLEGAQIQGDKNAKVTLVEFTDFQCPFCGRNFQQTYPQIYDNYVKTGKVKYVSRNFPLESIHPFAFKAAEAAQCAADQGKYWEMHDKLFTNQTALAADDLMNYSKAIGADTAKFKECLDGGKATAKVRSDMEEGRKAGVTGTPGFYLGQTEPNAKTVKVTKNLVGAQPYANFKDAIDGMLAAAK